MICCAIILLGMASSGVDVALAPDQPIPHVYVGDPLILELSSDEDVQASVSLSIQDDHGEESHSELGVLSLRAHSTLWEPVPALPDYRGLFTANIEISMPGGAEKHEHVFCRIDRPVETLQNSVVVHAPSDEREFDALSAVFVRNVYVAASEDDADTRLSLAQAAGFGVTVVMNAAFPDAARVHWSALVEAQRANVTRVVLDGSGATPENLLGLARFLREAREAPSIEARVSTAEELGSLLEAGAGRLLDGIEAVALQQPGNSVEPYRNLARRKGYERLPLAMVCLEFGDEPSREGAKFMQRLVEYKAARMRHTVMPSSLVFSGGKFGEAYVPLSVFARKMDGAQYVGQFPSEKAVAHVFQKGSNWQILAWTEDSNADLPIPAEGISGAALWDINGNTLPLPEAQGGLLAAPLGPWPIYIRGAGGDVLRRTAEYMASSQAAAILGTRAYTDALPQDVITIIRKLAVDDVQPLSRSEFFALVYLFPYLEEQWHTGTLPRSVAVPAMADLTQLVRHLAVLEEEVGEPFVEPYQETLNRCGQYQSLYLTRSGGDGGSTERGDWLLKEVSRLVTASERAMSVNRSKEANVLAILAEWRARALEYAAIAEPLGNPEPEPVLQPAPVETGDETPEVSDEEAAPEAAEPEDTDNQQPAEATPAEAQPEEAVETEAAAPEAESEPVAQAETPAETGPQTFTIEKGEGIWAIAQKHGVTMQQICKWNNWSTSRVLDVGEEYVIYPEQSE